MRLLMARPKAGGDTSFEGVRPGRAWDDEASVHRLPGVRRGMQGLVRKGRNMPSRSRLTGPSAALALALSLTAGAAVADPQGAVFAGGAVGIDQSAYAGVVLALPGSRLGQGWAVRAGVSGSEYDYDSSGVRIDGSQRRGELMAVRQWSGAQGYFNLAAGGRYTDTDLSPRDPGNSRQGGGWDVAVSADGARTMGPWRAGFFGSYGFDVEDYYLRGDLTHAIGPRMRLGAEIGVDGDPAYERRRIGAVVAFAPRPEWEVRLSAGGMESDTRNGAYGGIELTRTF